MGSQIKAIADIGNWMTADQPSNLPEILQGVFYMDGNGLPDDCLTLYDSPWNPQELTLLRQVFAPVKWTFHNSWQGKLLLFFVQLTRTTYLIQFKNENLDFAQITPILWGLSVPSWLIKFVIERDQNSPSGELWYRKNTLLVKFQAGGYKLRKVVDHNGQTLPAFTEMLSKVNPNCLVIT